MVYKNPTENVRINFDASGVGVVPTYVPYKGRVKMPKKRIGVVAGDRGGLNALLPVLALAIEQGHEVVALLTATCRDQYNQGKLPLHGIRALIHSTDSSAGEMLLQNDMDILLVAASQSEEGTLVACDCINGVTNIPIIGMEDMYGSLGPILKTCENLFSSVCVIDSFASELMLERHPKLQGKVVVTGGPQFDQGIQVKERWEELRSNRRSALKATDNDLVFLLAGGLNGTAELLDITFNGILRTGTVGRSKIILRSHPRATEQDKSETHEWLKAHGDALLVDEKTSQLFSTDDWLPGADFVLSGYSTVNHLAILYEMIGTVYVGTNSFKRDLMNEKGLSCPPEVARGAGWYVTTANAMTIPIQAIARGDSPKIRQATEQAQKEIAQYFDGKAAQRVWDEAKRFLIPAL